MPNPSGGSSQRDRQWPQGGRSRALAINATPGRSHDDYVLTVRHEMGHVIDSIAMDDAERATHVRLRSLPEDTPWHRGSGDHPIGEDRWNYGAEDFADVMVALMTDGGHTPRDTALAPAPTAKERDQIRALVDPDGTFAALLGE